MESTHSNILNRVTGQMSQLEKRDWELWIVVCLTSLLTGSGLIAILYPAAFLKPDEIHFTISVSRHLVVAFAAVLAFVNIYVITRRLDLRRVRQQVISTTIENELIRLQSFTDPLTEVYNRRSLDEMAKRFISQAKRSRKPLTFMLIDVDRFKEINTRFGHLSGDMVLAEIAAMLKSCIRGSDAVVRYGGDEFLVILADTSHPEKVVERIHASVENWNNTKHLEKYELSLSIGIGMWSDAQTLDDVLDAADRDMYENKAVERRTGGRATVS
jgi:diguanylate cyclase (GGDEF)-like protein